MSKYIACNTPGGVIWIEVENIEGQPVNIAAFQNASYASFQDVVNALSLNADYLKEELKNLSPTGMEISFGIKAGVAPGANGPIFGLSKGIDQANFIVKLKWEPKNED